MPISRITECRDHTVGGSQASNHVRDLTLWLFLALLMALLGGTSARAADEAVAPAATEKIEATQRAFFEQKIRPVLVSKCYSCHSANTADPKGGLLVDSRAGLRNGGDSGHAVVPGNLEESLLYQAIKGEDADLKMPPKQQLPAEVVADFAKWIEMGAPDPRDGDAKSSRKMDLEAAKYFWSFQPPRAVPVPSDAKDNWSRSDVDRFLFAQLQTKGLKPVGDAAPQALLRRVYFDLIGLPPKPEDIIAFTRDPSPEAFAKVVETLLDSPRFGERWGRHWLDVARYAESTGKEFNMPYQQAWRYRDYVIDSFNDDKPYDQFIREQIAGDLLPADDVDERNEMLIATGFLALGVKSLNERNGELFRMDVVDDQVDVSTRAVMGLTVSCARCHDHKFDPISTRDYYAMAGIFRSSRAFYGAEGYRSRHGTPLITLASASDGTQSGTPVKSSGSSARRKKAKPTKAEAKKLSTEELIALKKKMKKSMRNAGSVPKAPDGSAGLAMGIGEGRIENSHIYIGGETDTKGPIVPRGFLTVLASVNPGNTITANESGRRELADWLTSTKNPLTARVMANRVWQHLFGAGLVRTADDFGSTGEPPTHPELLDYLALQFMENEWSIKSLIRAIVFSRAYQLSSAYDETAFTADPDNTLLWRANPRRLDAEAIRDAILATSGQLDLTPAQGSVVAQVPSTVIGRGLSGKTFKVDSNKRSVFLPIVRDLVPEALATFDFAEPSLIVANRDVTNVPAQALFLMNSDFVQTQSLAMARSLLANKSLNQDKRIERAFLAALGRQPTSAERIRAQRYLRQASEGGKSEAGLASFCQALMASAEFRYLQ